jgi:hypothetical protein
MAMEMNRLWTASDFRALAKRIYHAYGSMGANYNLLAEKGETPTAEELQQYDFVAKACDAFLKEYNQHK